MQVCLSQTLANMTRQSRMARMTGRVQPDTPCRQEMQKFDVTVLLEDGLTPRFPPCRIDPSWSPEQLEVVLGLYHAEYQHIMSPQGRSAMLRQFAEVADVPVTSMEHHAQLREATLLARHSALSVQTTTMQALAPPAVATDAAAPAVPAVAETPAPTVHPAIMDRPVAPVAPAITQPAAPHSEPQKPAETLPPLTDGVELIEGQLTIGALMVQFKQAEAQDHSATTHYGRDIAGIFWRMAMTDRLSPAVARQRAADLRLFCFVTGVQTIDQLEQFHLRRYGDALKEIPKTFLRSCRDQSRSLAEIKQMARAMPPSEIGLAAGTVKRHIKTLELMLARAKSEGHSIGIDPDVKSLRPKDKGKAHKRRKVFTFAELKRLFAHSLWQGHGSASRRHNPGNFLNKDGRYWIPLILSYTGARRAEIAGLLPGDIGEVDGIPAITIQVHNWRGIKGEDKDATEPFEKLTRIVPIHSHLIELGLMEYVQKMRQRGETFLFPDVIPKPRNGILPPPEELKVEKFGETIDYEWRKSLALALDGNPRSLCMHSLRHYVNHTLIHADGVHEVTRLDLLGHVSDDDDSPQKPSVNTATYRDETPMSVKAAAIERLPRVF
jgi:integrase